MAIQIFLHGRLSGVSEFLAAATDGDAEPVFLGRSHWVSLLSEVLPRALLAELGLSKMLLGTSGGGQFLLLLPEEFRDSADAFLSAAATGIDSLSGGLVSLHWSVTENLGDWSDVRRRIETALAERRGAPWASGIHQETGVPADEYFASELSMRLREAESVGWSPDAPAKISLGAGKHQWAMGSSPESLPFARHAAPDDENAGPAHAAHLASRALGLPTWGVLRGDVDNFGIRLRRASAIDEHIRLSVMFKQFFAGELEVVCSLPEYWRKVSVIYSGGDDFAVYGAWDALLGIAAEIERLFHRFAEQNLADYVGAEAKTISMALAIAPTADASLGAVFEEAGQRLESAKSADKDCIWALGRTLEWKQLAEASQLKESLLRMIQEFGCSSQYIRDLCAIYRESQSRISRKQARKTGGERPWRYDRRIRRILAAARPARVKHSEFQKARTALIGDLIGRSAITLKLRPAGRVALEWARLSAES